MTKEVKFFEQYLAPAFQKYSRIPAFKMSHPTFVVVMTPAKHTRQVLDKAIKASINSDVTVTDIVTDPRGHCLTFNTGNKINVFIASDQVSFDWKFNYYQYYMNIIIGHIFKKAGLHYGESGLQYIQYDLRDNHRSVVDVFTITQDFKKIMKLLELDYKRFTYGFDSLQEFFDFICQTPYGGEQNFTVENKNMEDGFIREYFCKFIETWNTGRPEYKEMTMDRIKSFFKHIDFDAQFNKMSEKATHKLSIINKMNGKTIIDNFPGFNHKKIALVLHEFKFSFGSVDNYRNFMENHSQEEVIEKFKEVCKHHIEQV